VVVRNRDGHEQGGGAQTQNRCEQPPGEGGFSHDGLHRIAAPTGCQGRLAMSDCQAGLARLDVNDQFPVEGGDDLDEGIQRKVMGLGLLQLGDEGLADLQASGERFLRHPLSLPQIDHRIHDPQLLELLFIAAPEPLILEQAAHDLPMTDSANWLHPTRNRTR